MTQYALGDDEAQLLDQAGLPAEPGVDIVAATDSAARMRELLSSAFHVGEVANGLSISTSCVRQRRRRRALWAIAAGRSWLFPRSQFEVVRGHPVRQIRGLDQVLQAMPSNLHPLAVDGFLHTPQLDLSIDAPTTPLHWLRRGGDASRAVGSAATADWYGR